MGNSCELYTNAIGVAAAWRVCFISFPGRASLPRVRHHPICNYRPSWLQSTHWLFWPGLTALSHVSSASRSAGRILRRQKLGGLFGWSRSSLLFTSLLFVLFCLVDLGRMVRCWCFEDVRKEIRGKWARKRAVKTYSQGRSGENGGEGKGRAGSSLLWHLTFKLTSSSSCDVMPQRLLFFRIRTCFDIKTSSFALRLGDKERWKRTSHCLHLG